MARTVRIEFVKLDDSLLEVVSIYFYSNVENTFFIISRYFLMVPQLMRVLISNTKYWFSQQLRMAQDLLFYMIFSGHIYTLTKLEPMVSKVVKGKEKKSNYTETG